MRFDPVFRFNWLIWIESMIDLLLLLRVIGRLLRIMWDFDSKIFGLIKAVFLKSVGQLIRKNEQFLDVLSLSFLRCC